MLLTGPTNAFAVPVTQEVFDLEFMQYVSAPCMTALLDKAGILDLFTGDERLSEAEQMALLLYRFDKTQLAEFTFHLEHRKIYLSNTVREKPFRLRKAWYAITVEQCMTKLPE